MKIIFFITIFIQIIHAQNTCGDSCQWEYNQNTQTLTISGTGNITENTYCVSPKWSSYRSSIKTIKITGITKIGNYAFCNHPVLQKIEISETVQTIGTCWVDGSNSLKEIVVNENNQHFVSIDGILYTKDKTTLVKFAIGNENKKQFSIPADVEIIGDYAFSDASHLQSVSLSQKTTTIGEYAFYKCKSMKTVSLPDSLQEIKIYAFGYCESLENVGIPKNVSSIDASSFYSTLSLKSINVDANNNKFSSVNGVLFNKDQSKLIKYPNGKTDSEYQVPTSVREIRRDSFRLSQHLKKVIILEGTTAIRTYAFQGSKLLEIVTFPNTLKYIDSSAFKGCHLLKNIELPNSLERIDNDVFANCHSLESVKMSESITSIGSYSFYNCYLLKSITIPSTVTSIKEDAFSYCYSLENIIVDSKNTVYSSDEHGVLFNFGKSQLIQYPLGSKKTEYKIPGSVTTLEKISFNSAVYLKSLVFPKSVTSQHDYLFRNCTSLESVTIENGITKVLYGMFYGCSSLKSVTLPNSVTEINSYAFYQCYSLQSVVIPNSVTQIGTYAFYQCYSLKSITLPNSITEIAARTFYECFSLESITLPNTITAIKDYALNNCRSLKSLIIPSSVTEIAEGAFFEMSGLKTLHIPASVKTLGKISLSYMYSITSYTVDQNNENFISIDGIIYTKNKEKLLFYPLGNERQKFEIPNHVKVIGESSFEMNSNLKEIIIPNSVTTIDEWVFAYSLSLTSLNIPASVTKIDKKTFRGSYLLTSLSVDSQNKNYVSENGALLNKDKTSILFYASDKSRTEYTIPASVTSIEDQAFYYSSNLQKINVDPNNKVYTSIDGVLFSKDKTNLIQYPTGKTNKEYTIPNEVTTITTGAFSHCYHLEKIIVSGNNPNYSTDENGILYDKNKEKLIQYPLGKSNKEFTIPSSVKQISEFAFAKSTKLETIIMPSDISSIGENAFFNSSLKEVRYEGKSVADPCTDLVFKFSNVNSISVSKQYPSYMNYFCERNVKREGTASSTNPPGTKPNGSISNGIAILISLVLFLVF